MEECFDKSCDGGKLLLGQHEGGKGEGRLEKIGTLPIFLFN